MKALRDVALPPHSIVEEPAGLVLLAALVALFALTHSPVPPK